MKCNIMCLLHNKSNHFITIFLQYHPQVVRMFISIVVIFGICYLPYHTFYVYSYFNPQISSSTLVPHIFLAIYWLAMANSMVNPIIYYWMNKRFRHYFQRVICCCCFNLMMPPEANGPSINNHYNNNNNQLDNTFGQPNSYSTERKTKSCKFYVQLSLALISSFVSLSFVWKNSKL